MTDKAWDRLVAEQADEGMDLIDILHAIAKGSRALEEVYPLWLQHVGSIQRHLDYETAVGVAQQGKTGEDVTHWITGDLAVAMLADADHGTKMTLLDKFAGDTGYSPSEMREMHGTAKFWPPHVRKELQDRDGEKVLSWSHFNRARRGLELAEAKTAVNDALEQGWSVSQLEGEIQARRGTGTPSQKKRNKIKMAVHALGMLSGLGLPEGVVQRAKVLRRQLEDLL